MALEGSHQDQKEQGEVHQLQQEQQQKPQQRGRPATWFAGGGFGGGRERDGPASGSNISSRGGGAAAGGQPPLVPLGAIAVPQEIIGSPFVNTPVDIDHSRRVPYGWERCLNLKTGRIFYKDSFYWDDDDSGDSDDSDMSRNGKSSKLDLRLNLSARRGGISSGGASGSRSSSNHNYNNNNNNNNDNNNSNDNGRRVGVNNSPNRSSSSSSPASPPSSCVSSDTEQGKFGSPDPAAMVLVGCPHCLMYVMLSSEDPRCPRCKRQSTVLLDFLNDPKHPPGGSTRKS